MRDTTEQIETTAEVDQRMVRMQRGGVRVLREAEARTYRGAKYTVQLLRLKRPALYAVKASAADGRVLGEYNAARLGNAEMVFECFESSVFDLHTSLATLPEGLNRKMGRAWLKAEAGRCNPATHIVGSTKDCPHPGEGGRISLLAHQRNQQVATTIVDEIGAPAPMTHPAPEVGVPAVPGYEKAE